MEKINIHNYEIFFLDFSEGKLNSSQVGDLNEFLLKYPELKIEFDEFESFFLEAKIIIFNKKEELIKETQEKTFDITNFEYLAVSKLEKEITEDEENELNEIIYLNKNLKSELNIFSKTKLIANKSIQYPYKKSLTKNVIPIYTRIATYAIASMITLFLTLNYFNFSNSTTQRATQISMLKTKKPRIKKVIAVEKEILIKKQTDKKITEKQELDFSHKHTNNLIKQTLAFDDNEPQNNVKLYDNLQVNIPELKTEVLIFENPTIETKNIKTDIAINTKSNRNKDLVWQYAEKGVRVWKLISSSEIEMRNKYNDDGSIDKLAIVASNFKFSKTFNR